MSKEINLEGYRLAHTMMRVKDLEASFNFYCKTLGMKVLRKTDYPEGKFTNAFIGYGLETESPCLELTCNWDQKDDYDKGNGWGHVCIETPDVYKACDLALRGSVNKDGHSDHHHYLEDLEGSTDSDGNFYWSMVMGS